MGQFSVEISLCAGSALSGNQQRRFILRRRNTIHFDRGGRLFGAWWLNLEKGRRKNIRIQGEPPVELDFSNMFARLAYAKIGLESPIGDLYDVSGHLQDYDKAAHRSGVKMAFNALLFGAKTRLPSEIKKRLPGSSTMAKVHEAFESLHPRLATLFGTRVGFELMFQESEILMKVLAALRKAGIVGLGLHDAILVPQSRVETAKRIMEEMSREVVGHIIPTDTKHWAED